MGNAARKARKRAGVRFEKAAKVGTPRESRSWFTAEFWGLKGTRHAHELLPRSAKKRARALTVGPVRSAHDRARNEGSN